MSNPSGNQKPAPMTTNGGDGKPSIPIKRIQFTLAIDFPEASATTHLNCSKRSEVFDDAGKRSGRGRYYLVDYLPWMRHVRVTHYPSGHAAPSERMVHESLVKSWDPA